MWETKFHTIHTYIHRQVTVLCPQSLHFSVANGGGDSGLQFSRHSPNFINSLFLHERKFGSLISFPNAWIMSQSHRIFLPSLCRSLVSHYVHEKRTFLVFSAFTSGSTTVLATKKIPCFYLQYSSIYPLTWHRNNNRIHHDHHQLHMSFHIHIVISMFMILFSYFKANTPIDFGLVTLLIHYVKRPVKSNRVWFPKVLWKQILKFIPLPSCRVWRTGNPSAWNKSTCLCKITNTPPP